MRHVQHAGPLAGAIFLTPAGAANGVLGHGPLVAGPGAAWESRMGVFVKINIDRRRGGRVERGKR